MSRSGLILTTDRLLLTPWQSGDWADFHHIAADPEVMRYITGGAPWSKEQAREFVERQVIHYLRHGFCRWKAVSKEVGRLVGFCGAELIVLEGLAEVEIGWWLARHAWGRGLETEAASSALEDCLGRVGLRRVVSIAHPDNAASRRVMEKIGMAFERDAWYNGAPVVVYGVRSSGADLSPARPRAPR